MEKLRYEKVNNSNDVIKIDLHNGYSVIAMSGWNPQKHCYTTSLSLKENTIGTLEEIEEAENIEFYVSAQTINSAILKQVGTFLEEGFFDCYIKRYSYNIACVDTMRDLVEKERMINAS